MIGSTNIPIEFKSNQTNPQIRLFIFN